MKAEPPKLREVSGVEVFVSLHNARWDNVRACVSTFVLLLLTVLLMSLLHLDQRGRPHPLGWLEWTSAKTVTAPGSSQEETGSETGKA